MKYKFILVAAFFFALQFGAVEKLQAQTKEELEQLMKSPSLEVKKEKMKKPKKKTKAELAAEAKEEAERIEAEQRAAVKKAEAEKKAAEQREAERKAAEQRAAERRAIEQKEAAKAAERAAEERAAQERAAQLKAAEQKMIEEAAKETKPAKPEPKKAETKPAPEPKPAAAKEEPKPAAKTEPVKAEPKAETKPAAAPAKTEPAKSEPKAEPKPAATTAPAKTEPVKSEPKKEETKPATTTAPAKTEPAKTEPVKPAAVEPAKPVETPVVKQEPVKPAPVAEPIVIEKRKAPADLDEVKSATNEKLKELPAPGTGSFGKNKKLGDQLFERGSIANGLRYYEAALSKNPKKTFINQPLADGYFLLRDYATANKYYKALVDIDSVKHKNLFALYQYALTDKYLGNYEKAKENFNKFNRLAKDVAELTEQRKNANLEAQGCDLAIELGKSTDLKTYKIQHLNEAVNQPFTDYSPFLKDANTLYFGSWASDKVIMENKKEKYGTFSRIYKATRKGTTWVRSEEAKGSVNSVQAHTGNAAFSEDGNTMYYTQCLQDDKQNMRCKIYRGTYGADGWNAGEELKAINAEGFTTTHPAVGKNEAGEDVLYFASNRNSSKGMDIYYAKINGDGSLNKPQAVGGSINTGADDMTPYYDAKTKTLYFSSNGHINIGATDVFKSTLENGSWGEPQNLGLPVNSSLDDMYFMWNDQASIGFVVSNRPGGMYGAKSTIASDDIYQVDLNKIYLAVKGTQIDADSNKALTNGMVTLYDETSNKELKSFYAAEGTYLFDLEHDRNYKLVSRRKDYDEITQTVSTMGKRANDTVTVNFTMRQIPGTKSRVGERIGIVYWEFNVDHLKKDAPDTLSTVVNFMNDNPMYVLEVGSHTDSKGSEEYNLKLAKRRSDAVMKYLLSKKIADYRLESKAYGESEPLELNENPPGTDNPDGRARNRRTEFKVIKQLTPEEDAQLAEESKAKKTKKATAVRQSKASAVAPK